MAKTMRIYQLYGRPGGQTLSNKMVDYIQMGLQIDVLASSIKQAYYLASNNIWSDGPGSLGIVEFYNKHDDGGWHLLWDGCRIRGGLGLQHGASKTATTESMSAHLGSHSP